MLPKTGKKLSSSTIQVRGATDYASLIALALRQELHSTRHATKTLMRWTGASETTAKNWLTAKRGPSGQDLISLARHSNEVMRAFQFMVGRSNLDDAAHFELRELLRRAVELVEMKSP